MAGSRPSREVVSGEPCLASVQGGSSTPGPKPAESLPSPAGLGRSSVFSLVLCGSGGFVKNLPHPSLPPGEGGQACGPSPTCETTSCVFPDVENSLLVSRHRMDVLPYSGFPATGTCLWVLLLQVRRDCKSGLGLLDSAGCIRTREHQARTRGTLFWGLARARIGQTLVGGWGKLRVSSEWWPHVPEGAGNATVRAPAGGTRG